MGTYPKNPNSKLQVVSPPKHPLEGPFTTVEEAAEAKTDFVMNTIFKKADWDQLKGQENK